MPLQKTKQVEDFCKQNEEDGLKIAWRQAKQVKPLLLRGARQVGKSTAVRHLAGHFDHFLKINFEEQRPVHKIFEGDLDLWQLCENLSLLYNVPIMPGITLLFFDEIQACLPAISSLRFFSKNIRNYI